MKQFFREENHKTILGVTWLLILLGSLYSFASCSAVKKVLKDPAKIEIVGREWEKTNPCANDSVWISNPGTAVVKTDSTNYKEYIAFIDSLNKSFSEVKDSISHQKILGFAHVIDSLLKNPFIIKTSSVTHDTLQVSIVDRRREGILKDSIDYYHGTTTYYQGVSDKAVIDKKAAETALTKAKTKHTLIVIGLLTLLVGSHILRSYIKIPFLS